MKQFFCIIDTETTQDGMVADFAAVICDRKGNIVNQCAVLINGVFTDKENHELFWQHGDAGDLWSKAGLPARYNRYNAMVASGSRMIASVAAVNRWLDQAAAEYDPIVTAYNFSFDREKCANTGIDLTVFSSSFCLWQAAYGKFAQTKKYLNFCASVHAFNAPTKHGNMTYKTNAETMARFVLGNPLLEDEPHTALEDVIFYELPILVCLLRRDSTRKMLANCKPYNWKDCQIRDWFRA
jgi:hypothetical protein